jgi:hypothetical protein
VYSACSATLRTAFAISSGGTLSRELQHQHLAIIRSGFFVPSGVLQDIGKVPDDVRQRTLVSQLSIDRERFLLIA